MRSPSISWRSLLNGVAVKFTTLASGNFEKTNFHLRPHHGELIYDDQVKKRDGNWLSHFSAFVASC